MQLFSRIRMFICMLIYLQIVEMEYLQGEYTQVVGGAYGVHSSEDTK